MSPLYSEIPRRFAPRDDSGREVEPPFTRHVSRPLPTNIYFICFETFEPIRVARADSYNPPLHVKRGRDEDAKMTSSLASLTDCIRPQLAAVERLFHEELATDLACVNTLV